MVVPSLSKTFPRLVGIKYFSFFVELIFVSHHLFNFFSYPWFVVLPNTNCFYRHTFFFFFFFAVLCKVSEKSCAASSILCRDTMSIHLTLESSLDSSSTSSFL